MNAPGFAEINGKTFDTSSEIWRHLCEVCHIYKMRESGRGDYLGQISDTERRNRLTADLRRMTPEFHFQMEAQHVARFPRREDRKAFLQSVEAARGEDAANLLRERAGAIFKELAQNDQDS